MQIPLSSFELFPLLPVELRVEIFAAALPQPRFVTIEERVTEEYDESKYDDIMLLALKKTVDMEEAEVVYPPEACTRLLTGILGLNCDSKSMLRCFRDRWSAPILFETQLETYGFITNRSRPNLAVLRLLEDHGRMAIYYGTRATQLWSSSPIPALLHACRESRRTMQLCGYELTFALNTSETRIWYNFKYDVFCLRRLSPWTLRQIPSNDLARVERIAFEEIWEQKYQLFEFIPIFGHLKELLWVVQYFQMLYSTWMRHHIETENDLWGYLECDAPEFISNEISRGIGSYAWVQYSRKLLSYRKTNGGSSDGFFALQNTEMENHMREHRDNRSGLWTIPKTKHVFILTKEQAGMILAFRERFSRKMHDLKRLEEQQGPRSDYPFEDECDVLRELDEEAAYYNF